MIRKLSTNKLATFVLMLTVALITGLASCDDGDDPVDAESCSDGIKNQNETAIDCGGVCPPCEALKYSAEISGYIWQAKNISANYNGGKLTISGDNAVTPLWLMSVVHNGATEPGTYSLSNGTLQNVAQSFVFSNGSITITKWDKTARTVSGTYAMNFTSSNYSVAVKNGVFSMIHYD